MFASMHHDLILVQTASLNPFHVNFLRMSMLMAEVVWNLPVLIIHFRHLMN